MQCCCEVGARKIADVVNGDDGVEDKVIIVPAWTPMDRRECTTFVGVSCLILEFFATIARKFSSRINGFAVDAAFAAVTTRRKVFASSSHMETEIGPYLSAIKTSKT